MFGAHYWSAAKGITSKAVIEKEASAMKSGLGRERHTDHDSNRLRSKLIHKVSQFDKSQVSSRQDVPPQGQDLALRRHSSTPQMFSTPERNASDPISIPFRRVMHEPSRQIGLTRSQPIDIPLHRRSPAIPVRSDNSKFMFVENDFDEFEHGPWLPLKYEKCKLADIEYESNEEDVFASKPFPCSFAVQPSQPHSIDFDL